jgi:membrane fusion protein, multidrug efflux system
VAQARSRVSTAQAQLRYAETQPQQISVQRSRARAAEAETERAAAALQQAQLNLQYTTIVAPVAGIVGQRSVHPGQNVSPGQQLMTVVPLDSQNIWVTANFKETQLTDMRPASLCRCMSIPTVALMTDAY